VPVSRGEAGASMFRTAVSVVGEILVLLNTSLATLVLTVGPTVNMVAVQQRTGGFPDPPAGVLLSTLLALSTTLLCTGTLTLRVRETVVVGVEKWSSSLSAAVDVDLKCESSIDHHTIVFC